MTSKKFQSLFSRIKDNKIVLLVFCLALFVVASVARINYRFKTTPKTLVETPTASVSASPTATPTPKPLTFAELNARYGPCAKLPVLMYHHIENWETAKLGGYQSLTVSPDSFRTHLQYLKNKNYTVISPQNLINFFDQSVSLPSKPVLITFDDGYQDIYTQAYPILREFGYYGTVFLSTGLVENPGYLSWNQINDMAGSGLIYFGNHTWSHRNVATSHDTVIKEIKTADKQLSSHGLNIRKVFAYPYGNTNQFAIDQLRVDNYSLAFTTVPGQVVCKKLRLSLPRSRIGNANLNNFGI